MNAQDWIEALSLRPHPEGGYFGETYRSTETIAGEHLPARFGGGRAFSTAIYFLLRSGEFSALHRIRQDEVWHFYDGESLDITVIDAAGELAVIRLGRNLRAGETPQAVVPAGCLFGASLEGPDAFALVGCTVAPGFDFADLEMPSRRALLAAFPQHRAAIERLTRPDD